MKNVFGFLFLLMTLSITSCSNKDKSDPDETYLLKMRFNKGDKFSQDITTNLDMIMMKMNMDMGMDFEVVDSTASGKELKITYTKLDMKMEGLGEAGMDSAANKANQKLIGKSVIITLEGNKVVDVKGFEALTAGETNEKNREIVGKMFSKENINSMFGMMFNMYPETEVKVGDTWKKVNTIDVSGMAMELETEYKLNAVKDGIAELGLTGTISSNGSPVPGTDSSMKMKMDLKGTQTGKMFVKVSDGYIKEGNYDLDLDMNMGINEQVMPMKMKATYLIKGR